MLLAQSCKYGRLANKVEQNLAYGVDYTYYGNRWKTGRIFLVIEVGLSSIVKTVSTRVLERNFENIPHIFFFTMNIFSLNYSLYMQVYSLEKWGEEEITGTSFMPGTGRCWGLVEILFKILLLYKTRFHTWKVFRLINQESNFQFY